MRERPSALEYKDTPSCHSPSASSIPKRCLGGIGVTAKVAGHLTQGEAEPHNGNDELRHHFFGENVGCHRGATRVRESCSGFPILVQLPVQCRSPNRPDRHTLSQKNLRLGGGEWGVGDFTPGRPEKTFRKISFVTKSKRSGNIEKPWSAPPERMTRGESWPQDPVCSEI